MTESVQRTPFYFHHCQSGARLVPFAGWEMPLQFEGILAEHQAVRERAGLFDISHMAQLWVSGPGAGATLDHLVTNDVSSLKDNRGLYALLCRPDGGVVDDLYIYRLGAERFLVIANAARAEADRAWLEGHLGPETEIAEQPQPAALALQGPRAAEILRDVVPEILTLRKNDVVERAVLDREMVVARTGYTGEDGFEFFGAAGHLLPLHQTLLRSGAALGLASCGLGARDTLRLEMGYRLYGHDLDEAHSALESGLGWAVKLDKGDFIGREALRRERERGSRRRLIGFRLTDRGVPREGCELVFQGASVGRVTSGTFSPTLRVGLGLGFVDNELVPGTAAALDVVIHGRPVPAEVAALPFYKPSVSITAH